MAPNLPLSSSGQGENEACWRSEVVVASAKRFGKLRRVNRYIGRRRRWLTRGSANIRSELC
jgi:hypothetical protein